MEPRRLSQLASLVVVLGLMTLAPTHAASAVCVASEIQVAPGSTLRAGSTVEVRGTSFVDGCNDSPEPGRLGCSRSEEERPSRDVELVLTQDGRSWTLGREDAGSANDQRLGEVRWRIELPTQARPGVATLTAGEARLRVELV